MIFTDAIDEPLDNAAEGARRVLARAVIAERPDYRGRARLRTMGDCLAGTSRDLRKIYQIAPTAARAISRYLTRHLKYA